MKKFNITGLCVAEKHYMVDVSDKLNQMSDMIEEGFYIAKDEARKEKRITGVLQYDIVKNERFDMELCLCKFAEHYQEIFNYNDRKDVEFLERHGRMVFLSYLKPLINGKGFYHIESAFTDLRRMDLIVDYGIDQFILELKLWKGESQHEKAYEQLLSYMETKKAKEGYLLTFDFRIAKNRKQKAEWTIVNDKKIFDVII